MKRLQRYDIRYDPFYGEEEIDPDGDWVQSEDVTALEEKVVRLEAERDEAMNCLTDVLYGVDGPATERQVTRAGDDAVAKWKANR